MKPAAGMEPATIRQQLDRILSSRAFADAERASRFLRLVTELVLQGRACEIKESTIALEAFGRSPSFDPKSDPVVRVEARRLRDRLSAYYATEGVADTILFTLPKGGYVPEFAERASLQRHSPWGPRRFLLIACAVLFAVILAVGAAFYQRLAQRPASTLRVSILPPENTSFESFAISPDGRKLAFTAALNGTLMLWVRRLDSLKADPLGGTEAASYPFWSPDSQSIGFYSSFKLKTIDIHGGPPGPLPISWWAGEAHGVPADKSSSARARLACFTESQLRAARRSRQPLWMPCAAKSRTVCHSFCQTAGAFSIHRGEHACGRIFDSSRFTRLHQVDRLA